MLSQHENRPRWAGPLRHAPARAGRQALPRTYSYAHARATYTGAGARSIGPHITDTHMCASVRYPALSGCEESQRAERAVARLARLDAVARRNLHSPEVATDSPPTLSPARRGDIGRHTPRRARLARPRGPSRALAFFTLDPVYPHLPNCPLAHRVNLERSRKKRVHVKSSPRRASRATIEPYPESLSVSPLPQPQM